MNVVSAYNRLLVRRPYAAHTATAGVLWMAGDLVSQKLAPAENAKGIDWKRVGIMAGFGICCAGKLSHIGASMTAHEGPVYAFWYRFLDSHLAMKFLNQIWLKPHHGIVTPRMQSAP